MWQKVPVEERRELATRAQGRALDVCLMLLALGCGAAIGLGQPYVLLGVAAFLPILFQVITSKTWLEIKPQMIVRYFVACMTARHFARHLEGQDMNLKLIFRGSLEPLEELDLEANSDLAEFADEIRAEKPPAKDVWVSLFSDSLIMISENVGGATLEFGQRGFDTLAVELQTPEDEYGRPLQSRLVLESRSERDGATDRWLLTSPHTTTLLACERKLRFFNQRASAQMPPAS